MSLRKKVFFFLATLFFIISLPIIFFEVYYLYQIEKKEIHSGLKNEVQLSLNIIHRYFFDRANDLYYLADSPLLRADNFKRIEIENEFKTFIRTHQNHKTITLLDIQGKTIAHSHQNSAPRDFSDSFQIKEMLLKQTYASWYEFSSQKNASILMAIPIKNLQGIPFRILVMDINLLAIDSILNSFGSLGIISEIYNREGILIYSSKPQPSLRLYQKHPDWNSLIQKLQNKTESENKILEFENEDYYTFLGLSDGFFDSKEPSWALLVKQDQNVVFHEWKTIVYINLALIGIELIILGLLLFPISNWISKPIIVMSEIAQKIGQGDYKSTEKLPLRNDELGILSHQIREMSLSIQASFSKIQEEKDRAEEANKAKDIFLAVMSHEMRTPLNGIIGFSKLLLQSSLPSQEKEQIQIISTCGEQLLSQINDILDYTKISHGAIVFEKSSIPLFSVVEDLILILSPQAKDQKTSLSYQKSSGFPDFVQADPLRIKQLLNNLLSNAVKFTSNGSVKIELHHQAISARSVQVKILVQDTGIGIAPEYLSKLFQPFSQADSSISRKFGGTGLGLAICKKIVDYYQGTIEVATEPGKGTLFTVKIVLET